MIPPDPTAAPTTTTPWAPPKSWHLEIFDASGYVIASLARTPHQPLTLAGDPDHLFRVAAEVHSALSLLLPNPHHLN